MCQEEQPVLCKRPNSRKRLTDPFQIFCAQNRPETTAQNSGETVGTITSISASRWLSMPNEKKMVYVEFAKKFDMSQSTGRRPKPRHHRIPATTESPNLSVAFQTFTLFKGQGPVVQLNLQVCIHLV
jgi:hypothetical protein